ncbi:RagB/SusD family nutrient uptake outer membrane protein [Dysgonomonas sp. Marseille-P4677]|uniref:RagB/SusD family nutrient uptake outer membrane protein n=1 Tax=Dysgonomonas sp. Marseille-P4677 TaxID=2364790 RepID=UPI001913769F|nr:RagB/SusD family nutrient uptake outer membrane protein [Dysgonomonas sp. Marseille-P4677]MBK5722186.1 RagB/SusD family nutrient uptake outer membrane protein [Dysgonomonas sp. Marseille-P4677]
MKKYNFLIILSVLFFASACSDSFFDLEPSDKVPKDKIYKTAEDFNIAVVGCYAKLQSQVSFYTECSEYRGDNMLLLAPTTGTQDRYDIDQFKETAANGLLDDYWANFNNGVYRCNLVLDQIDAAVFDSKLRNQYKAEALFIRAYTYFNMYRIWGGVPTTRTVVDVSEALKIGRSSEQQMYDLIAGDLKQIVDEQMLPVSYKGDNMGRVTLGAAQSLLGKVYLTFKKYQEAQAVLSQVIGKYSLQENPGDVFNVGNKMNNEIIFAVRFNKNIVGEGHGYWFTINNPANAENPSPQLLAAYTDPADKRKDLITYTQVESNVYILKKFYDTKNSTTSNVGNDQILIRYADVLLMYAEALNEVAYSNSPNSPALNALNEVHTRAGLQPVDISTLPNKDAFRKAILIERQQEFPFEGHRWFDLVRMGYAKEIMAESGHNITDSQLLFPIPKSVIERVNNIGLVWQNPGYN